MESHAEWITTHEKVFTEGEPLHSYPFQEKPPITDLRLGL